MKRLLRDAMAEMQACRTKYYEPKKMKRARYYVPEVGEICYKFNDEVKAAFFERPAQAYMFWVAVTGEKEL